VWISEPTPSITSDQRERRDRHLGPRAGRSMDQRLAPAASSGAVSPARSCDKSLISALAVPRRLVGRLLLLPLVGRLTLVIFAARQSIERPNDDFALRSCRLLVLRRLGVVSRGCSEPVPRHRVSGHGGTAVPRRAAARKAIHFEIIGICPASR
jgi:hypothetical protein